jgi:hypothetical protein
MAESDAEWLRARGFSPDAVMEAFTRREQKHREAMYRPPLRQERRMTLEAFVSLCYRIAGCIFFVVASLYLLNRW